MSGTRTATLLGSDGGERQDLLAVEEPLEIRLGFEHKGMRAKRSIAITMRTPGHDAELATGFLHGEGIVKSSNDIGDVRHCGPDGDKNTNIIGVELADGVQPELARLQRNFYTTSSCGVCGKSSLEALDLSGFSAVGAELRVEPDVVHGLSDKLRESQSLFDSTGGLHAAALFDRQGALLTLREDVGRHNAVDKLVGWALAERKLPLDESLLFLSGRASFELLQKALAAQIPVVCAVGAPSSLAVDLAERFGITLLGFVRDGRFNVYSHAERVV